MKTRIVINHIEIEAEPEDVAEAVRLAFDAAFAPLRAGLAQLESVDPDKAAAEAAKLNEALDKRPKRPRKTG